MKKTILLSSVFIGGAALAAATVPSENAIGVLEASASNQSKTMLVAVPFVGYAGETAIKVTDLVATTGLPEGTKLRVAKAGGYDVYVLSAGKWEPGTALSIDANGGATESGSDSSEGAVASQGDSFWLIIPTEGTKPGAFTLIGQMPSSATGSRTLEAGKWNLIGNPGVGTYQLNVEGAAFGDQAVIITAEGKQCRYTYKPGKGWRTQDSSGQWVDGSLTLSPGFGCWILTAGTAVAW